MTLSQPSGRRAALALLAVFVVLTLVGCSALMLLLEYLAVASSIKSIFNDGGDDPGYELSGYVYIDRTNNKIGIEAESNPPSEPGTWEVYSGAVVSIDTSPVRTTVTNGEGYFRWKGIQDTRVILTVEISGAEPVQFDVELSSGDITPL
jgi:hypothetical protein